FISLRSFTGGYHALSYAYCTFVTLLVYASSMLLSNYLPINYIFFILLFVVGSMIIFVFSPVKNPNKIFSAQKASLYKRTSLVMFSAFCIVGLVSYSMIPEISCTIFYTLCADIILIFPKNTKNKGKEI
ncbi:MAG: accessory gene regulator B family protein, partial [Clostridia bacterium]|nr:accessory gene regulator B family protein [Clostridia bacterium]